MVRPVRVLCTGRVSSDMVMRAFGKGADGVAIIGCYLKECDFETGSKHMVQNVDYLKGVLQSVGVNPERLQAHFCSAAEGQKFQRTMIEMTKTIKKLGPSPLRELAKNSKKKKKKKRSKKAALKQTKSK